MGKWSIYPEGSYARGLCKLIDDYADEALTKIIYSYGTQLRKPEGERDQRVLKEKLTMLEENLSHLDEMLEGREWMVADRYSLADISLFSPLWGLETKVG